MPPPTTAGPIDVADEATQILLGIPAKVSGKFREGGRQRHVAIDPQMMLQALHAFAEEREYRLGRRSDRQRGLRGDLRLRETQQPLVVDGGAETGCGTSGIRTEIQRDEHRTAGMPSEPIPSPGLLLEQMLECGKDHADRLSLAALGEITKQRAGRRVGPRDGRCPRIGCGRAFGHARIIRQAPERIR